MGTRTVLTIAVLVLVGYLAALLATDQWGIGRADDGTHAYPHLLEDRYDVSAYQKRGRWTASGATPYLEEFSEYPQLTTWAMGFPYLFIDHGIERGEPYATTRAAREHLVAAGLPASQFDAMADRLARGPLRYDEAALDAPGAHPVASLWREARRLPGADAAVSRAHVLATWRAWQEYHAQVERDARAYANVHHVVMAVLFAALILLVLANLRQLGAPPWPALVLLLPATLYFSFNRHDLPVTVLVLLALLLQLRGRFLAAGFVLGLGLMTKWYPLVLAPLFLSHAFWSMVRPTASGAAAVPVRTAFARGVLAPGLAIISVVVAVLGITYVWHGGGWPAVTAVFEWHRSVRQPNTGSVLTMLVNTEFGWGLFDKQALPTLLRVFTVLQLAPAFVIALLPLRSRAALIEAAIFATCGMVIFSKFFSPQWFVWIAALAALRMHERWIHLVLVVLLQFVLYWQFPLAWFSSSAPAGNASDLGTWRLASDLRVALLFAIWFAAAWGIVRALSTMRSREVAGVAPTAEAIP